MTPTRTTIHFESAYLLRHVNMIDAHPMHIQFDSLRMHIETRLQRASCERAFSVVVDILDYVNRIGNRRHVLNHTVHSFARCHVGVISTFVKVICLTLAKGLA